MTKAHKAAALCQALASLSSHEQTGRHGVIALGTGPVDDILGGGLARGAVHEIFAPSTADFPAAAGFAAGISQRAGGPLLWVRQRHVQSEAGLVYGQGLSEIGVNASEAILVLLDDIAQALRAAHEALRCEGLGAVILEIWGGSKHLNLTASRRLALAAEESGVTALMLRARAEPDASSAATRWEIATAPSADPLGLPGQAAFSASLLRQRGSGAQGQWHLEWNHETRAFSLPALSGAVAASFVDRPADADRGAGWARTG